MKRTLTLLAAISLFASCSKKDDNPAPATTSAKFSVTFPAANVHIDSMQVSYKDASGSLISSTVMGVNTWESPVVSYAAGKNAYASVKAFGTTLSAASFIYPSLYLKKTADNTVISAAGSSTVASNVYTFSGEVSHDF